MPTSIRNTDILFNDGSTQTAAAPRARVTFDGRYGGSSNPYYGLFTTGAITTIFSSANISSITKNAIGDYTINFSTAMPNTAYTMVGTSNARGGHPVRGVSLANGATPATGSYRVTTGSTGGSGRVGIQEDCERINLSFFI